MERMWNAVLLWWATYPNRKDVKCGRIVMGDLPKNGKNMKCGLIVIGDLPRWKKYDEVVSLWWATYPNRKNVKNGLIMMGDLPRWKKCDMTNVKNRTYLAKFWRDDRRRAGKTWCFLIIPDHRVWKTRCFLTARLIFSFLWDFPNGKVPSSFIPWSKPILYYHHHNASFFFPPSCWTSLRIFL